MSTPSSGGCFGKAGRLNIRVSHVKAVDGQRIELRSSKLIEGEDKEGKAAVLTYLAGPIGLLKKGKDAVMPEGTPLTVYVDEDATVKAQPGSASN